MAGRLLCIRLLLLCVTAACAISGCAAGARDDYQPPETAPEPQDLAGAGPLNLLASPLELLERGDLVRSPAEAMCWLTGTEHIDGLCNRVGPATPGGASALFEPAATGPGGSLADCAWAVYSLNLQDYAPGQQLVLNWDAALVEGTAYFGVSEWATGAWRWFAAGDGSFSPGMPALAPYIRQSGPSAGVMLLAVVVTGTEPAVLNWLRLGDPPATWERSWDNMGTPFACTADPETGDIYIYSGFEEPVTHVGHAVFTKLDAAGSLVWSRELAPGQGIAIGHCVVDSSGSVMFCGSRKIPDVGRFLLLFKLSPQGEFEWGLAATNYESAAGAICLDGEDNIYLGGYLVDTDSVYRSALALKLDPEGAVQWTATWDGATDEYLSGIAVLPGGQVIGAGSTNSFGAGSYDFDILLLELDPQSGLQQWNRMWGGSRDERCNDMSLGPDGSLWIAGKGDSFYKDGLWLSFSPEQDAFQAYSWGSSKVYSIEDEALQIVPHGQLLRIVATTRTFDTAEFLIDFDPVEEEIVAIRSWGIAVNHLLHELLLLPDTRTLVLGKWHESSFPFASWHAEDLGWFHETFANITTNAPGVSLEVDLELEELAIEFVGGNVYDNTLTGDTGAMTLKLDF